MMNPDVKVEWIAALGEATQGREGLRPTDDTRCCLGVLCDVAARHGIGRWGVRDGEAYFRAGDDDYSPSELPDGVVKFAGLEDTMGARFSQAQLTEVLTAEEMAAVDTAPTLWPVSLADLNDRGVPFSAIQKLIDRYL